MTPAIHSTVPVISTNDILKSIAYFTEVLGFLPDFVVGDPVVYAGVKSGDSEIYFAYDPDFIKVISEKQVHPEIFVWVPDVEKSYSMHKAGGAEIIEPLSDRPWGARQYVIREINGYHLKWAQPL